ncbi:hypothetical protein J3S85_37485 [Streptomyces lavenduligriseus]|nr:hypothetical protein J3S85_37485 [Streptomyces lavenduligriseus]
MPDSGGEFVVVGLGEGGAEYGGKRIMIGTGLAAAAVVTVVPLCWTAGVLSVPVLYAVALLLGALTVLQQAVSITMVPEIVDDSRTHPANARIAGVFSLADMAGTYGGTSSYASSARSAPLAATWPAGWRQQPSAIRIGSTDSSGTRGRPRPAPAKGAVRQADGR